MRRSSRSAMSGVRLNTAAAPAPTSSSSFCEDWPDWIEMEASVHEWLNLFVRWIHVFAGILWIGQTFLFSWLDKRLEEVTQTNPSAQVWMVHSGGFYLVGKQKMPELLPQKLHWFKWEAASTWLSGMMLLILVYYAGGLMVDDAVSQIGTGPAIAVGLALLPLAWLAYDFLWRSPLSRYPAAAASVSSLLVLALAFCLPHLRTGPAASISPGLL